MPTNKIIAICIITICIGVLLYQTYKLISRYIRTKKMERQIIRSASYQKFRQSFINMTEDEKDMYLHNLGFNIEINDSKKKYCISMDQFEKVLRNFK